MKTISEMSIGELAAFVCDHLYRCGIGVTLSGGGPAYQNQEAICR